ncbi:MAG: hypothetical protein ACYCWN_08095 [Ferrimicrobium sp.]|jgi:hypothetical protein|uniref:Uncharacterized protein n=1 Tax=Ferrimicrobium acidiphilum TaxID=121039 RepID=A0ABV3Y380_9ACTN|nr:hypothetical protein [Ferrimicrobium sp.]MCL5972803.1 hypothetical protein [Actinomycetota bacterium]MDA8398934.1 hypothetical protein [Actinomycetota bacterium]
MSLFDKVKEQAQTLTQTATEAAQKGQDKLDQLQAKRQLDALYRELGAVTYRAANQDLTPEVQKAETERLVSAIRAQEELVKPADQQTTDNPGQGGTTPPTSGA